MRYMVETNHFEYCKISHIDIHYSENLSKWVLNIKHSQYNQLLYYKKANKAKMITKTTIDFIIYFDAVDFLETVACINCPI